MNGYHCTRGDKLSLAHLLEPAQILETTVLALSIFSLVAFLWLTLTVWLNGDRRTGIVRLGVVGLSLSALFFFIHAVLISSSLPTPANTAELTPLDYLWHLLWLPALGVPYIWFAIGLHYAALIKARWRRRRPWMLFSGAILGCIVLLLLILNQSTATYAGTLRLLAYAASSDTTRAGLLSSLVLLPGLFLAYVTFCAIGPWFTPGRVSRLLKVLWQARLSNPIPTQRSEPASSLRHRLAEAFWDDPADLELLEEPVFSWHVARPGLLLAALLMAALTTTLGVLCLRSPFNWLAIEQHHSLPAPPVLHTLPFNLIVLDLIATGTVALIILLIGYSIVRHGILIERPLARRGFFEQWRGIVIVATTVAIFIALLVSLTHSSLVSLLLITSLATAAYAMFTWSSYTAHDRYIALLGPFLRSTGLRHWLNTDLQKTEQGLESLFFHLCHNVLAVQCARLTVIAGSLRHSFNYRWPENARVGEAQRIGSSVGMNAHRLRMTLDGQSMICWVLPMYDDRGLAATLYLGPRQDGGAFTDEDMDLAHACGQRILDTLGNHEAMQAVAELLRRRIVDVKLLGAQQRRVLHDEILPQMHLALLRLETLREIPMQGARQERGSPFATANVQETWKATALDEAVDLISDAHRRLAAMMRTTTPSAPHHLERDGMIQAIRTMLEQDFQHAFDEIGWHVSDEAAACIDELTPPAIAELIFAAVQEVLRNAARHARGTDVHRRLRLTLQATCAPHLEVIVADDGVGIASANSSTTGTGGGLLTHSALLAIAGGSLTIKSAPDEGVTVRIFLPAEALR